ncbi:type IV toxin-antitoxin system AbiEi family antitoxin domain-containing protein, partial [Streptococcus pneumoniae]|uniref:type IV toxin-antitoxin system AbiEi family antitoxin domain-containing protein n=1 Tax=Streptococcus pneumoniae TaxID=1313 RepID=UPI003F696359
MLNQWERARITIVRIDDIRHRIGTNAAYGTIKSLVKKKILLRVGRGVYIVRSFASLLKQSTVSTPTMIAALLEKSEYY